MAPQTTVEIAKRIASSREAAAALFEDLEYMRAMMQSSSLNAGDARRLAHVLRRLLVEGDLNTVAAPRVGRISLLAPDNFPYYSSLLGTHAAYFISGGCPIFGFQTRALFLNEGPPRPPLGFSPEAVVKLKLDNFVRQNVIYAHGAWVNRSQVIKYVSNVASGVHSGAAETAEEIVLARIRGTMRIAKAKGSISLSVDETAFTRPSSEFKYTRGAIDAVLYELLAAAHFLLISPEVVALKEQVGVELDTPTLIST